MSKRITQKITETGDVSTSTSGSPRGTLPNFDVSIFSPSTTSKKGAEMVIKREGYRTIRLDGRNLNTLYNVLSRHFEGLEEVNS